MMYFMMIVFLVVGALLGALFVRLKQKNAENVSATEKAVLMERMSGAESRAAELRESALALQKKTDMLENSLRTEIQARAGAEQRAELISALEIKISEYEKQFKTLNDEKSLLSSKLAALASSLENREKQNIENLKIIEDSKVQLAASFKNLANEIFDEKSKKFSENSKNSLEQLLNPLGLKIRDFEKKVEETHEKSVRDRSAIIEKISQLQELNKKLSEDASNLTKALKGESKTQGNWGEVILERILESSGLQKGLEYEVQASLNSDEGDRYRPDVIIKLPENRHVIIDSKVSLTAYERYSSLPDGAERNTALDMHTLSIRKHVDELHQKNYQNLSGVRSPDFVMMFVPVEPALTAASQKDGGLFTYAIEKSVAIVTSSTLLATLRTVAYIWKQEKQNRNAAEIARQSGLLYDRLCNFVSDLDKLGRNIEQLGKSHSEIMSRLNSGRGNLLIRAENIRKLGAKNSKQMALEFLPEGDDALSLEEAAAEPLEN